MWHFLSTISDQPPHAKASMFAWPTFLTLLAVLIASSLVFWILVRRATTLKKWVELAEWADEHHMAAHPADRAQMPAALAKLTDPAPRATLAVVGKTVSVVQFHTEPEQSTVEKQSTRWNALLRQIATQWPPTGLRPRANASSLIDLLPMSSFPSMAPPERFVVFGTDSAAARQVAKSSVIALLPPDVGFLLLGDQLILDFTSRPFDTIELPRLMSVAEQVAAHLPIPVIGTSEE